MRKRFSVVAVAVLAMMLMVPGVLAATTIEVNDNNLGGDWRISSQTGSATYEFALGPGTPPEGAGSFHMMADNLSNSKVTLLTDNHAGSLLADIDGLTYATYRDGDSVAPADIVPSVNLTITNAGPDGSVTFTTLVWEPTYPFPGTVMNDQWQTWDTMAPTASNFAGGWWSSRAVGLICASSCFVDWNTVIQQNPDAIILEMGVNLGTGPSGTVYSSAADAYSITIDGDTTTYDFEPLIGPPTSMDDCKKDKWQTFNNPSLKNQGDCVSYVRSNPNSNK